MKKEVTQMALNALLSMEKSARSPTNAIHQSYNLSLIFFNTNFFYSIRATQAMKQDIAPNVKLFYDLA